MLVPTVALFCLNWNGVPEQPATGAVELDPPALAEPESSSSHSFLAQSLTLGRRAASGAPALAPVPNPFASQAGRAMMPAQADPFLAAYQSGTTEGELVVRSRSGGVVTFGAPTPRTTRSGVDREILAGIDKGLAGSFSRFFASVLSGSAHDEASIDAALEENPFLEALRELQPVAALGTAKKTGGGESTTIEKTAATETGTPAAKTSPAQETPPAKTVVAGGSSVVTVRPHLLLKIDEQGALRATAASRPGAGLFEAVELGVRDFQTLTFSEPADAPFSMAVADFNGDGETDVVVHVVLQGMLRFYYAGSGGKYTEETRIQVGRDASSVAAGDFDGDGRMDVALSYVGTGLLSIFYGDAKGQFSRFKIFWSDTYRDYIAAQDGGSGLEIVGATFGNRAAVLVDSSQVQPAQGRTFDFTPALSSQVSASGKQVRVNAAVFGRSFALNVDNRSGQLAHVLNFAAGSDGYAVIGDLESTGRIAAGLAALRR